MKPPREAKNGTRTLSLQQNEGPSLLDWDGVGEHGRNKAAEVEAPEQFQGLALQWTRGVEAIDTRCRPVGGGGGLPMANVGLRSDGNLQRVTWVAVNTGETGGCSGRVPGKVLCKGWPDKRNAFQLTSKRTSPWLLDEGIGMGWRGGRCGARPEMAVCVCVCMWCLPGESGGMRIEIVFKEPKRGKERKLRAETADGRRWAVSRRGREAGQGVLKVGG